MGAKGAGNPLHHDIAVPRTNLTQLTTRNHNDLLNINAGTVYEHISAAQVAALHAQVTDVYSLRAVDDRNYKPNTTNTYRFIKAFFTTLEGMTGAAGVNYQDLLLLNTYGDATGGDINALTFDKSTKLIKHWLADQAAGTWGTPKTLAYTDEVFDGITMQIDGINSNGGIFNFRAFSNINLFPSNDPTDGLSLLTVSNIPYISVFGGNDVYIRLGIGTWQNIHADNFILHSEPLPRGNSTDKILNVKNKSGKLDHKSLPSEAYFIDKNNENEGMKLGAMVLHLTKTIQELNERINELEKGV